MLENSPVFAARKSSLSSPAKVLWIFSILFAAIFCATGAHAHFGMIIPSKSTVMEKPEGKITLDLAFAHPFAQQGMNMQKPAEFFVLANGRRVDLLPSLKEKKYLDKMAWQGSYDIGRPGVYQFAVVPEPYWEPAEDNFIVHYSKTVVAAFGAEDGWDTPIGLPVEIVPLSRPFAAYAGNVFSGIVLKDGKPQANVPVEVENLNKNGLHKAPNSYFETLVVNTDANGVFNFGIPWAGWWGFAALCEGNGKIEKDGQQKAVEAGGIIWIEFAAPAAGGK